MIVAKRTVDPVRIEKFNVARSRRISGRTVVLIEDDEFLAAALRDLLQFHDYRVVLVNHLRGLTHAIEEAAGRVVVLLDPMTRGISPAGVLRALTDGQTLITIAVAVYAPTGGNGPNDDGQHRTRRPLSTDLLLEMIAEAFGEAESAEEAMRLPRAA
jgi:DNA-binding NtrC family response regulator